MMGWTPVWDARRGALAMYFITPAEAWPVSRLEAMAPVGSPA